MKKRLINLGMIGAAFIFAVMMVSQTADAKKADHICPQKVKFEGAGITVKTYLTSSDAVPLARTSESMVDGGSFPGGKASDIALIANPMPGDWTFDGLLLHANSDCELTGDPVQASFSNGAHILDLDDDTLKPDNDQEVYEGAQAVAGWPNSSFDDDDLTLARAICQEVKDNLSDGGSAAGVDEMLTAARIATAAGLANVEETACLATADIMTIVGGGAGCTVNDLLASSAMLTTAIADIEPFGPVTISLSSEGDGDVSFELDNGEGDCTSCTIDLEPPDETNCMDLDCGDC